MNSKQIFFSVSNFMIYYTLYIFFFGSFLFIGFNKDTNIHCLMIDIKDSRDHRFGKIRTESGELS